MLHKKPKFTVMHSQIQSTRLSIASKTRNFLNEKKCVIIDLKKKYIFCVFSLSNIIIIMRSANGLFLFDQPSISDVSGSGLPMLPLPQAQLQGYHATKNTNQLSTNGFHQQKHVSTLTMKIRNVLNIVFNALFLKCMRKTIRI